MIVCYFCLQFFFNANIMLSCIIGLNTGISVGSFVYIFAQPQKPQTLKQTFYVMFVGMWIALIMSLGADLIFSLESQTLIRLFIGSVGAAGLVLGLITNFFK